MLTTVLDGDHKNRVYPRYGIVFNIMNNNKLNTVSSDKPISPKSFPYRQTDLLDVVELQFRIHLFGPTHHEC